jgi:hypothetical protein
MRIAADQYRIDGTIIQTGVSGPGVLYPEGVALSKGGE